MIGRRGTWLGRARTAEAAVLVAVGGVLQRRVPMRRWSRVLGRSVPVPAAWRGVAVPRALTPARMGAELEVRAAVRNASARLPWQATCLAEAFAGQVMLRRRGRGGVVVIGLRRDADAWQAHAWLLAESGVLTGGSAAAGFTATGVFEVAGGLTATALAAAGSTT